MAIEVAQIYVACTKYDTSQFRISCPEVAKLPGKVVASEERHSARRQALPEVNHADLYAAIFKRCRVQIQGCRELVDLTVLGGARSKHENHLDAPWRPDRLFQFEIFFKQNIVAIRRRLAIVNRLRMGRPLP